MDQGNYWDRHGGFNSNTSDMDAIDNKNGTEVEKADSIDAIDSNIKEHENLLSQFRHSANITSIKAILYIGLALFGIVTIILILKSWISLFSRFLSNGGAVLLFFLILDISFIYLALKRSENKRHIPYKLYVITKIPILLVLAIPFPFLVLGVINLLLMA